MSHTREGAAGFTLLEVLIAFAIAAITLAVVIEGSVTALSSARIARDTQNAIVRARSRLAALEGGALVPGERDGDDGGGFRWRSDVTQIATGTDVRSAAVRPPGRLAPIQTLYAVRVTVTWAGGRSVRLDSTRLAAASP